MDTYFTLIKHVGNDIREIGDNLTEDAVRKFLLRSVDESLYEVSEYHDCSVYFGEGTSFIRCLNGEDWLIEYL